MRSLDEMRPKIVELTGDKVELGDKIASLEHALRNRDAMIAELESNVEELRDQYEETSKQREEGVAQREKEQSSAQASLTELQKAYTELQRELEEAQASIHGRGRANKSLSTSISPTGGNRSFEDVVASTGGGGLCRETRIGRTRASGRGGSRVHPSSPGRN